MHAIGGARAMGLVQPLERPLPFVDGLRVEQLAQLGLAQELAELGLVHGEGLRLALGQGRVAVVEIVRDVAEEQGGGERRRRLRVHRHHAHLAAPQPRGEGDQRGQVEDILQTLAVGLQDDGERAVARGDGEEVRGPLALHPQGRAQARPPPRQEEGARRRLAEMSREHGASPQLAHDEVLDLVRIGHEVGPRRRIFAVGDAHHDPVVAPDRLHVHVESGAQARSQRQRPRRVHAAAPGREQAQPPVPHLVARALQDQRTIVGQDAGGLLLLGDVGDQVLGRARVEVVLLHQPPPGLGGRGRRQLARQAPQRAAQLHRPRGTVALPERHLSRLARSGDHEHAVALDLHDAPARRAQDEHLARPALEHHLLVELADPTPAGATAVLRARPPARRAVREEYAVEATVRDGARVGDGEAGRPLARADGAAQAVPHQARPQLRELVGGIAAGKHVQHALELCARQPRERGRPPDEREQAVHRLLRARADRHHLLREHVERVHGDARLLDLPLVHGPRDRGRGQEVAAVLGEDGAARDRSRLMPAPPDALQTAGHRRRGLDLDHEIDGAHVDAELQGGRGHDRGQAAGLEVVLDLEALLAAERAVMRADQLLARELVEGRGHPLGQAPAVDEHERGAVGADQLQQAWMDGGPDRRARGRRARRSFDDPVVFRVRARPRHVLDRDLHRERERLARPRVHDLDGARTPSPRARLSPAQVPRDLFQRTLRRAQADALGRLARELLEALERQGQVRAALAAHHGVDLVHDHGLDGRQHRARLRGQDQEERFRRRDQDVGRLADHPRPLRRGGVAGAQPDHRHVEGLSPPLCRPRDPGDGRAQVALDVHGQRAQRGDVHDAAAVALGDGREHETVDRGQERGQRLAGAGGGEHQGVPAGLDGGPAPLLGEGGRREGRREPLLDRGMEADRRRGGARGGHQVRPAPPRSRNGGSAWPGGG